MRKGILQIGIIILGLGIIFTIFDLTPKTISTSELSEDFDGIEFNEFDEGDEFLIKGRITSEIKDILKNKSINAYQFDNENITIYSSEDIGSEGDEIIVDVKVINLNGTEAIEVSKVVDFLPSTLYFGIIFLILGIVITIFGIIKKRKE